MVEGLGKGVKYSLYVANFIIFVGGLIVFGIGVVTLTDKSYALVGAELLVASATITIVTGSIVAIISFLGMFGANKEIRCMLLTYFVILLMLFIVMITASILGYIFRQQLETELQQSMYLSLKSYGNDSRTTLSWDTVHKDFKCCGVHMKKDKGYELWRKENSNFRSENGPTVPGSCCRSQDDDPIRRACLGRQPSKEDTYFEGCYDRMKEELKSIALLLIGVAIGAACLMIFGMVLSFALYLMIK